MADHGLFFMKGVDTFKHSLALGWPQSRCGLSDVFQQNDQSDLKKKTLAELLYVW